MASDFFLYAIYNKTVGPGILAVTGDEASDVIVYSHCAPHSTYGANGTVDNFTPPYTHISPRRVLSTQWHCWGCSIAPTLIWGSAQPTSVFVSESAASYLTYADVCTFR